MFDAYADMYAYSEGETAADEPPSPEPEPVRAWDERGKTGLYGGGGRGADDRETGWVRNFEPDEDRHGNRDSRFRADSEGAEERRRSSSEQSSFGPVTPNSAQFPKGPGPYPGENNNNGGGAGGYQQQAPRPSGPQGHARTASHVSHASYDGRNGGAHQRQLSSTNRPQHAPPVLGSMAVANPVGPGLHSARPMQQVDPTKLKNLRRPGGNPAPPPQPPAAARATPQRPMNPPPVPTHAMAELAVGGAGGESKRPKPGFKFGRGKKGLQISAPILPEGFVESLGMETFALTPGCAAPTHALGAAHGGERPSSRQDYAANASRHSQGTARPNSLKASAKGREPGPRPKQVPTRPVQYRYSGQGISIAPSSGTGSPQASQHRRPSLLSQAESVRTPLDALRGVDDRATYFQQDAFRRLSRDSVVSYAPSSATLVQDAKTSRKFFDGIREERARQANEEAQANSRPVMPPMPKQHNQHASRDSDYGSDRGSAYHSTPIQSKGGEVFNNPFGGGGSGSGGSQGAPSVRRQSTFSNKSLGGAGRAYALSQHRPSISSGRTMGQPPSLGHGSRPQDHRLDSDDDDIEEKAYRSMPGADEHRGSASSAYSDTSEPPPPANAFHPGNSFSHGYTTSSITQPLRKNSLSQQRQSGPTEPLGRRPSHAYTGSLQQPSRIVESSPSVGGDVVWGSGVKSPAAQSYGSPQSGNEGTETLGSSGFTNPFAAKTGCHPHGGWQPGWQ